MKYVLNLHAASADVVIMEAGIAVKIKMVLGHILVECKMV